MKSPVRRPRGAQRVPLVAALAIAVIAVGAGYYFGTPHAPPERPVPTTDAAAVPPPASKAADPAGRKVLYWHDPMAPGQKFAKPGKSPFMDMELVPVYADAAPDAGVAISARQQQSFGVRTALAIEGSLDAGFGAVGVVGIDERALVAVQARSPGYVERLLVRAQYDSVSAGQPLAELYVPEWLAAQEELLALKASPQTDVSRLADAARNRLLLLGMPAAEIARVERDGKPSARVTMTAPQAGIVWEIGARDGMAVSPGTTLFKLAGIGTVWVTADVPEAQAGLVRSGAPVEAHATAYPDRAFKGSVNTLLPEVNAQTRTVRARIVLANPGGALKPGMFATVKFGGASGKPAVLVPTEAVISTGKRTVVIADAGEGRFHPVEVEVGRETGDLTEIRKGVSAGRRVVVSGQFLVDSEASLKGAIARISAEKK
jgi:membrane fusion protein, copper/silver efflux system